MGLRLRADKVPELAALSMTKNLQELEDRTKEVFAAHLNEADLALLDRVRYLRNKLLHCDLSIARRTLTELGREPSPHRVLVGKIQGPATVEKLLRMVEESEPFDETQPSKGMLLGWVMQMAIDGSFQNAKRTFIQAIGVLDRLALIDQEPVGPPPTIR
jgi:hypothetical protein